MKYEETEPRIKISVNMFYLKSRDCFEYCIVMSNSLGPRPVSPGHKRGVTSEIFYKNIGICKHFCLEEVLIITISRMFVIIILFNYAVSSNTASPPD